MSWFEEEALDWFKWLATILGVMIVAAAGTYAYGTWLWGTKTRQLMERLEAARRAPSTTTYSVSEIKSLPAPVQRYFRTVLKDNQRMIAAVTVEHTGTFNMGEDTDNWKPFTSEQKVVTSLPGFVWNGHVAMLPGLPVDVHDAYVAGEGILNPAILGLFELVNMRGGGEVARGELMRYFAEAAWYPTALLPSQGVRWEAVDDRSAKATLADGSISLTMLFRFSNAGLIDSIRAEARGRAVGKSIVVTPWEGRWSNYQENDGMMVPLTGEVAWITPEGAEPYWRGSIKSIRYEYHE
jgi:hypothetical protein